MNYQKNVEKNGMTKIMKYGRDYIVYEKKLYGKNTIKKVNLAYFKSIIEALGEIYQRIRDRNLFTTDGMWKVESEDRLVELIKKSEEEIKEYICRKIDWKFLKNEFERGKK